MIANQLHFHLLSLPRDDRFCAGKTYCHANLACTIRSSKLKLASFSIVFFSLQMLMNAQVLKQIVVTQMPCVPILRALMFVAV